MSNLSCHFFGNRVDTYCLPYHLQAFGPGKTLMFPWFSICLLIPRKSSNSYGHASISARTLRPIFVVLHGLVATTQLDETESPHVPLPNVASYTLAHTDGSRGTGAEQHLNTRTTTYIYPSSIHSTIVFRAPSRAV